MFTALKWAAALGLIGFIGGYVGPVILTPEANQGPLLGIFITGPLGFLLGLVIGGSIAVTRFVRERRCQMRRINARRRFLRAPAGALHAKLTYKP